jgi:RimJ/RimL family protein N-acetyltransferase
VIVTPYRVHQVLALYKQMGLKQTVPQVYSALRFKAYHEQERLILSKRLDDDPPRQAQPQLVVRSAEQSDTEALLRFTRTHRPQMTWYVRKYLRNRYRGVVAFRGEEVIGLFWWVDRHVDPKHPDLVLQDLQLEEAHAYGFAYYIAPEHRGGGTATEVVSRVFAMLRDLGYQRIWGYVDADNVPARWLYSLVGFEATRRVRLRILFGLLTLSERRILVKQLGPGPRHNFGQRVLIPLPAIPDRVTKLRWGRGGVRGGPPGAPARLRRGSRRPGGVNRGRR